MLLKGEIEEEDIGENGLLWEAMEFEIVSDKEGELFFFIDSHVDAIKFLTAMVKVDTELSSKSKKFIKRGLLILKRVPREVVASLLHRGSIMLPI